MAGHSPVAVQVRQSIKLLCHTPAALFSDWIYTVQRSTTPNRGTVGNQGQPRMEP